MGEKIIKFTAVNVLFRKRAKVLILVCYDAGQKLLRKTRKTASYLKPQAIENSFKRAYGEVEDNIIIYIERLKT